MDISENPSYQYGLKMFEKGRYYEAVSLFAEVLQLAPDNSASYRYRGLSYHWLGMTAEAKRDLETVVRLDPSDALGFAMLADICRFRQSPAETLEQVVAALDLESDQPQALFIRGWLFAAAGQYAEAVEDLKRSHGRAEFSDTLDLLNACSVLAAETPCNEFGDPIVTREDIEDFLSRQGWSFDRQPNPKYAESGFCCRYAHCIRNCPILSPEVPASCPLFGNACPGDMEQTNWCRAHSGNFS
ncbi:MAG: tetratricopeptide repeat protein [Planctomycetota bacterium]|jgi:tetratricopeptide (TPR) repeat protein|nr:tetratricopeptide repeat protein [Planctomycetota bacterium]